MELVELPNVGKELAECLERAGIRTPEELKSVGSVEAAVRISPYRPGESACRNALCALEGALRGVRWHAIPKTERDELWRQYQNRMDN